MTADLLRSNVEASKRLFLDRLTTDQQPINDPANRDGGPGDNYVYANVGDSNNFGIGFDCSGLDGVVIAVALFGYGYFTGKGYFRIFSTETFPASFVGFTQVSQAECMSSNSPIKVMIGHHGGGADSHMACIIDGWHMESNGDYGVCGGVNWDTPAVRKMITPIDDTTEWNDWWIYTGGITEDTEKRQAVSYPLILDYAGGYIPGADLKAAGVTGVCRYINDGGTGLPKKLLQAAEFIDLLKNGLTVDFNFETTATFMLTDNGAVDAQAGLTYVRSLLDAAKDQGITHVLTHDANGNLVSVDIDTYKPVILFSADFDEAPNQDDAIFAFFDSAHSVLGDNLAGHSCAGGYGAYWILMRAFNSGHVYYLWQTEAWSGGNIDSDIALMQRNGLGYQTVDGVQCDINEAHKDDYGQVAADLGVVPVGPVAPVDPTVPVDPFVAWYKAATDRDLLEYMVAQDGPGDPSWSSKGMTDRDKLWEMDGKLDQIIAAQPKAVVKKAPPKKTPVKKGK
jgi:hypothetical protein